MEILKEILKEGIVKIEGFFDDDQVSRLKEEVLKKISQYAEGGYQFGKSLNFIPIESLVHSETEIHKAFDTDFVKDTVRGYLGDSYLHAVQSTHDYIASQELARNGFLHFDRFHTLKFFVYLTDCDDGCGPFNCVRGSRHLGSELRSRAWEKAGSDYGQVKNRIELDYPDLEITKEDATPMTGKAGDLLIFDSDVLHFGGVLEEGNERLVLRLHYMKT